MKHRPSDNTEINADAFLDTVANLVGILVILVVVVASQTRIAAKAAVEKELKLQAEDQLEDQVQDASQVERDLIRQARVLQQHELEIIRATLEREKLLVRLIQAKEVQAEALAGLTKEEQDKAATQSELTQLQEKIAALIAQNGEVDATQQPVQNITLQHLPTPMAKTVFGDEVHVMLEANQVSVIPWDRLVGELKRQAEVQVSRVVRADRVVDTLGPVDGFVMKYALKTEKGLVSRGSSVAMAQRVELEYFVLDPTQDVLREDVDQALSVSGRLRAELALRDPRSTTVTVWVYDDSFGKFRELKEQLFVEGFLTAARPLPRGIRVGASPGGSNSSAQ